MANNVYNMHNEHIAFFYLKKRQNATETQRKICVVYGECHK